MNRRGLSISRHLLAQCLLLCAMLFVTTHLFAQKTQYKGLVISAADNLPVVGATVRIKGTQQGVITDFDGNFVIQAPKRGTLTISYVGHKAKEVKLNPKKKFYKIILAEDAELLDEVVVVGYGKMKRKEVTGAVARVETDDVSKMATSDLGNALQGQIAGVNVQASSAEPGSSANILIRGISSVTGSNNPLWVVDGVPYEGDPGLSPSEIQSMDVLKDAASCAIYGTRGAAGVILVTTKSGKAGQMKVKVDGYYGIQHITSEVNKVDAAEYMYLAMLKGRQGVTNNTDDRIWTSLETYPYNASHDSNLNDVVQNNDAAIQNYSVNLSGGQKNLTYSIVGNYFDQEGVIINSGYERYNIRANAHMVKDKFVFDTSMSAKIDEKISAGYGLLTDSYRASPLQREIDPDAAISTTGAEGGELQNLGSMMAKVKENSTRNSETITMNASARYNFKKNLYIRTRLSAMYSNTKTKKINPLFELYDSEGELYTSSSTRSAIRDTHARSTSMSWETQGQWNLTFNKHHKLNLTAVYSMEKYDFSQFYAQKYDLISSDVDVLNGAQNDAAVGSGTGQWGQDKTNTLIGILARAQYNYKGRYMVSASIRRDGSSRFAESNRWGSFPSASVGWNMHEEKFWKPIRKIANSAKIRLSLGTTGNQNFIDYATYSTINTGYDYSFGSEDNASIQRGATQTTYSNPEVKWETTTMYNLGIDLAFLRNKITFSADMYKSYKKDMLFPLLLPRSTGVSNPYTLIMNMGDMTNQGLEFALGNKGRFGKHISYNLRATYATNTNEVTKMSGTNKLSYFSDGVAMGNSNPVTVLKEGEEAGAFYTYPTNGIANTEQKLAEYQKLRPSAKMGDLIYVDTNKDGVIDDDDRTKSGSGAPEHELGLNLSVFYKNFDFSMAWYASIGNEIMNGTKIYMFQYGTERDLVYSWNPKNPTSPVPTYYGDRQHFNYAENTDLWVEDGSYLRLKNISIGYKLPKVMTARLGLNKLRFYVSADNLLTLTKYDGYDPEVGNNGLSKRGLDYGRYPITQQFRGGFQLEF